MKNLVCLDIETTGLNKSKDYIIQLAAVKIDENFKVVDKKNWYVQPDGPYVMNVMAAHKHGITPQFLSDKPFLIDIVSEFTDFIADCDILTYNGNRFDLPFIYTAFQKIGVDIDWSKFDCYDAYLEESRRNGMHLTDVFTRYTGKTMEDYGLTAHNAYSDVMATIAVYKNQQINEQYGPDEMLTSDGWLINGDFEGFGEQLLFAQGKYKGMPVALVRDSIDSGYISWINTSSDASPKTKELIKNTQFINRKK